MVSYNPGFDIRAAAEGAKAATDIALQPTIQETAKAAAKETIAKAEYETGRYQALQEYMKGTTPGSKGAEYYQALNANQEIQQRQQAIASEEERIRNLAPEDQVHARTSLDRQQKLLDAAVAKQQQYASKHLDETFAILNHVTDQKTLEGARQFYRDEVASVADQAIRDGKIAPENREAYINDQVDKLLPKIFDEKGKAMIDSKKNAMLTAKEQVDFQRAQNDHIRAMASLKQAENQSKRIAAVAMIQAKSSDLKEITALSRDITAQEGSNNKLISDNLKEIDGIRKELIGFGAADISEERKEMNRNRISELTAAVEALRNQNAQLGTQREVLMEKEKKLGGISSPKEEPKSTSTKLTDFGKVQKIVESHGETYDPVTYEYRLTDDGKVQRKLRK